VEAIEVRFRILGELDIVAGNQRAFRPGPREQRALAVLLLGAGHVVSGHRLAEAIWADRPPARADKQLSNVIYRLRRALGPGGMGEEITADAGGYRLRVAAGDLDAAVFRTAVITAAGHAADGWLSEAVGTLRDALSLWRGPALTGLGGTVIEAAATALNEQRLTAQATYGSHLLALGRHEEVAADLTALVADHPVREDLVTLLMTALYRCGRQADALDLHARTRARLVEEFGIEPGLALRDLHWRVLVNSPDLAAPAPSCRVETVGTVRQSPWGSPAVAGNSAASPAGPAAPEVRYSLPPDAAAFTGRGPELTQVTAAVAEAAGAGGVVAVRAIGGMPGIGKTALAVHAAYALAGRFPDRQLFIDLHAHTPGRESVRPEDALAGLLAAAGVDARFLPADLDGRARMWRDAMAGQKAVLVLDNAASTSQVAPLLPGSGECLVLVTSRRHLGDLPGVVTPVLLDVLAPEQAREMFTRLAPRAAGDPDGVAEVVGLAGFLPLAVSLLARVLARHPSWSLAGLAAETRDSLLTLTAEHDSVAAAFGVSYRHLDTARQRFFALLGLHPGAATDPFAAAALTGTTLTQGTRLLDGLHGEGLLTETGHRRYGMHDLLRRYARDHAAAIIPAEDAQRAMGRLLDYYQHTATRADAWLARQTRPGPLLAPPPGRPPAAPGLDNADKALGWARSERASLLACLDHATRTGQHARVTALTAGLAGLLRHDGFWAGAITRHTTAVHAARRLGDRLGQANALNDLGDARWLTGDYPGAARDLERALGIYRDLGDRLGQANAFNGLGTMRRLADDYPGAARHLERALGIYRDLGDLLGQASTLNRLGDVRTLTGEFPAATRNLEHALGIYRDLGDRLGQAQALGSLGVLRRLTGEFPAAAQDLEQALSIHRDLGNRLGQASILTNLGEVQRLTSDYPGAARALEQALGTCRDLGDRLGQASTLTELGTVGRLTGNYLAAARALEQALAICRSLGNRGGEAQTLNETGTLHRVSGNLARAQECHQQALELARAIGSFWDEAHALGGLGRCAVTAGHPAQAGTLMRQALGIFQQIGTAEVPELLAEIKALTSPHPAR
jgi:DNA-binding SARP family transcriptional activator/tetratricopeptide (TPR) repeat protein